MLAPYSIPHVEFTRGIYGIIKKESPKSPLWEFQALSIPMKMLHPGASVSFRRHRSTCGFGVTTEFRSDRSYTHDTLNGNNSHGFGPMQLKVLPRHNLGRPC